MKNVIIVTFINAYNYGAFLQAKATEVLVLKLGYKPRFLNYCNFQEESQRRIFCFSRKYSFLYNLKRILYKVWYGYWHGEIKNGKKNFQKAIDDLPKTKKYYNINEIEKADIFLCGSDQIWNPDIFNGEIDPIYFGGITNTDKIIAFSSSFGSYSPSNEECKELKQYFDRFSAIAVREQFAKNILSSMGIEKKVTVVLDPTLCLDSSNWKMLSSESKYQSISEDYILLYFVNPKIQCQELIDYVKKELKLKTIWVKNNDIKKFEVDKILTDATPYDFVALISHAKFVLTDSFHGTAFAINMNINFVSILNSQNPERVKHLCKILKLEDRMVDENEVTCETTIIDYTYVNKELCRMRELSINWLKSAME